MRVPLQLRPRTGAWNRQPWWIPFLLVGCAGARAEIVDRIAVTIEGMVITESDLVKHLRIAAFLNGEPPAVNPETKRTAARRLVEQHLVRREMEISRYPAPDEEDVDKTLRGMIQERFREAGSYEKALAEYGVAERDLRNSVRIQLTVLRFIRYRFQPAISTTDEEVEAYYRDHFAPDWAKRNGQPAPPLEEVRIDVEELVIEEAVDQALDAWLEQAASQAAIDYREEVFQ